MNIAFPPAPVVALSLVFGTMGLEALRSRVNERALLALGAHPVPDPSYRWMQLVYPLGFVAVCAEGWWRQIRWTDDGVLLGMAVFLIAKAVKYAAIAALGQRWCFKVLVLPGVPLVTRGIYRWLRHPNYVGVAGEVIGSALWMRAPITGTLFAVTFGVILLRRIRIEERALGLARRA